MDSLNFSVYKSYENKFQQSGNATPNFLLENLSISEIISVKEKRDWLMLFRKEYEGPLNPLSQHMYGDLTRFFVAKKDGKSLGFIVITDWTEEFVNFYNNKVWCASSAYVKKSYRKMGVLYSLLDYVIKHCDVKLARIETERLYRFKTYYNSLGFTSGWRINDSDLTIAVIDGFSYLANKRNDDIQS